MTAATHAAAAARAARQRRERFVRKRSESAAREIWTALVVRAEKPKWQTFATHLAGIRMPTCGCVQCAADAMICAAEQEANRHARDGGANARKF